MNSPLFGILVRVYEGNEESAEIILVVRLLAMLGMCEFTFDLERTPLVESIQMYLFINEFETQ